MTIGEKIKQKRMEIGLSMSDLAEKMGYKNRSTIARIEDGEIDIPYSKLLLFAEVLNIPVTCFDDAQEDYSAEEITPVNSRNRLGITIKNARIGKGLTQEELGKMLGVEKSAVAKYENGRIVNLKQSTLRKLATILEIDPSNLIESNEEVDMLMEEFPLITSLDVRTIGQRIRVRRKELHMSAERLGTILGKDRATIYRYENGLIEKMPLNILEPVAMALGVTVDYLLGKNMNVSSEMDMTGQVSKEVLAHNLRYYQNQLGKTAREIAADIDVPYSTYNEWANAKKYPRIDKIERLAAYFGVTKSDLTEEHSCKNDEQLNSTKNDVLKIVMRLHDDDNFYSLVEMINKLDKKQITSIKKMLNTFFD